MKAISSKKLFWKNCTSRFWLFLLILIAGFFIYPVDVLMMWQQRQQNLSVGDSFGLDPSIGDLFLCKEPSSRALLTILIVIAAFAAAAAEFNYLHKQEAVDFWNAAAVTRKKMAVISWCAGAVMVIVPFIITYVTGAAVAAGIGAISGAQFGSAIVRGLYDILLFLTAYTFASLGQVVSGRTFIGVCMGIFFTVIGPTVILLYTGLCACFFPHIPGNSLNGSLTAQLSPVVFSLVVPTAGRVVKLLLYLVGGLVLYFLAAERRPAESAGNAFSFRFLYPVVKVAVTIAGSLGLALLVSSLFVLTYSDPDATSKGWFFFFMLMGAVLIPVILDLIIFMDWRGVKKGLKLDLICLPVVVVVTVLFMADPFAMDSYVPADSDVAAVSIGWGYANELSIQGNLDYSVKNDTDEEGFTTNPEAIKLAGEAARAAAHSSVNIVDYSYDVTTDYAEQGSAVDADGNLIFPTVEGYDEQKTEITLNWKLKNGKIVNRVYAVPIKDAAAILSAATEDPTYREATYLANKIEITGSSMVTVVHQPIELAEEADGPISLSADEAARLTECLREDSLSMTLSDYLNADWVGELDISSPTTGEDIYSYYVTVNLFSGYTKTLAFLKEKGFEFSGDIDASKIFRLDYFFNDSHGSMSQPLVLPAEKYDEFFDTIRFVPGSASTDVLGGCYYQAEITLADGDRTTIYLNFMPKN